MVEGRDYTHSTSGLLDTAPRALAFHPFEHRIRTSVRERLPWGR